MNRKFFGGHTDNRCNRSNFPCRKKETAEQRAAREAQEAAQASKDYNAELRFLLHSESIQTLKIIFGGPNGQVATGLHDVTYSLIEDPSDESPDGVLALEGHFNSCLRVIELWSSKYIETDHFLHNYYGGRDVKCTRIRYLVRECVVGMLIGVRGLQVDTFSYRHDCNIQITGTALPRSSERVVSIAGRIPDTLKVVRDMCLLIAARRNTMTRNINLYHPAFYDLETAKHSGGIWNCCTSQNSHLVPPDTTKKHCLRPYQDTATVSLTVKNKSPDLDGNQTLRTNRCSPNKQQRKSRTGGSSSARRASLPKPGPRKVAEPKETKGIPTATADLKCFWMKPEMELKPFISQTTGAATFAPAVVSMQKGDSCLQNPPGLQSNWNQPTSDSSQTLFSTYRENFALRSVYPCFPQYFSTPYSLPAPLPNWPWPGSCAQTPVLIALPKSNLRVQCLRNNRPNGSNLFPRDYRRRTVISPAQHSFFRPFYPSPPNIVAPYLSGRFPPQPFQNRSSNFSHQWHRPLGHESPFPQVVRSPQLFQPTFVSKKDGDFNRPQYLPGEFHGNWQPAQSYDQTNLDPAKNSRPPKGPLELRQSAKDPGPSFGDVDHNQLRMGSTTDINPAGSETDSVAAPAPPGNREALYIFTPGEANPFHPTIVLTESTWVRFGARLQVYGLVNPERTTLCCELDYLPGGLCNENYIPKRTEMIKNLMSTVHEFYFDEEQIEKVTLAEAAIVRLLSAGFCSIDQFWKTLEKTLRAVERKYDQRLDFPDPQTEDHKSARPFFSYVTVGKKGQKCPHSKAVADGQSGIACYVRSGAMVKRRGTRRKYRLPCPKFLASSRK